MDRSPQPLERLTTLISSRLFDTQPQLKPLLPRLALGVLLAVAAVVLRGAMPDDWTGGRFVLSLLAVFLASLLGGWQSGLACALVGVVLVDMIAMLSTQGMAFQSISHALVLNGSHLVIVALTVWGLAMLQRRNQQLRESIALATQAHSRFVETVECAAAGIVHIALDGRILMVNNALCQLLSRDCQTMVQRPFVDFIADDQQLVMLPQFQALSSRDIPNLSIECQMKVRADGDSTCASLVWVQFTVALVQHCDNTPDYYLAVVHDITKRKIAQADLQNLQASLERRIVERTHELRAAYAEMEQFSHAVAHDLRSPLRVINGFASAIEEEESGLSDEGRQHLQRIRQASATMGELINGLLQLSHVARGEVHRTQVDVSTVARKVLEDLSMATPERHVNWKVQPGITVHADAPLVQALMLNLLNNAWKYTAKQPQAEINVGANQRDGREWTIVRDNGDGFDMAKADKLFKPFQRLHGPREFPGLGIGVATVHRIIDRHQGEIIASSKPGQGAVFTFTLTPPQP